MASPDDASVSLSFGAVSYNVKRSLASGGPDAFVANKTATSFTDNGLSNGTTYYYVVTALNTVKESLSSTEADATPLAALQQWHLTSTCGIYRQTPHLDFIKKRRPSKQRILSMPNKQLPRETSMPCPIVKHMLSN